MDEHADTQGIMANENTLGYFTVHMSPARVSKWAGVDSMSLPVDMQYPF